MLPPVLAPHTKQHSLGRGVCPPSSSVLAPAPFPPRSQSSPPYAYTSTEELHVARGIKFQPASTYGAAPSPRITSILCHWNSPKPPPPGRVRLRVPLPVTLFLCSSQGLTPRSCLASPPSRAFWTGLPGQAPSGALLVDPNRQS